MWNQWKEAIKNIFTKEIEIEVEEIVEIEKQERRHQDPHARMMYQYPESKSFRFPVIPDEPVRKVMEKDDLPAYKKKQQRMVHRQDDTPPAYTRRNADRAKRNEIHATERISRIDRDIKPVRGESIGPSDRKVYKKNPEIPFQPTEVPSPIYGFQKRQKEVENIPAFVRKENRKEDYLKQDPIPETVDQVHMEVAASREEESGRTAKTSVEGNLEPYRKREEMHEERKANTADSHLEAAGAGEFPLTAAETEPSGVTEAGDGKVSETGISDNRKKTNPIRSSESRISNGQGSENTTPFNVMMTPRDKKNLFDRQNRQRPSTSLDTSTSSVRREEAVDPNQKVSQPNVDVAEKQPAADYAELHAMETVELSHDGQRSIPYHLLNDPVAKNSDDQIWVQEQQELLEQTLKYFNVRAKVVKATQGPSVTRFEVHPEMGVKVSKIKNLSDDLKLNMAAKDIRIEAPIPGKNTVGIEVPNPKAEMVGLQGIFETADFKESKSPLSIALGLTIEGHPKITNIQKMPHGLIAGATGSGKSVCINTILISLIYKASHEDVKFLLIDPKMVELAPYNGIPHLVAPVITDVKAATQSLKWAVNEMEERYEKFVEEGVRDIERYNQKVLKQGRPDKKMPFIVIVIDELADLMMMSPQDVEDAISRIAQKARACGIHLLLATQRPSVDVITGLIKANIPTRIAFSVSSQIDSRTILDSSGAEKLLGKGDMLFVENGTGKSVRLQGPFVSDEEIERVTAYARSIAAPNYLFEQEELLEQVNMDEDEDELLEEAIQFVLRQNSASTSLLQRHFKIGYNRAARLIDSLEMRGIISGQNGSKPRDVLVTQSQLDEM